MISWLARNRLPAGFLAAAYSAVLIFGHGGASRISDRITDSLTRVLFNRIITALLLAVLVLLVLCLVNNCRRFRANRCAILFPAATALLAVAGFNTLMVTNIESIHFPLYALLAVPVCALTRKFGAAVLWTTLLGALDEAYQYFWLYRNLKTVYFDFNDVVLNLIGAGMGVTVIYLWSGGRNPLADKGRRPSTPGEPWLFLPAALGLLLFLAVMAGPVHLYPDAAASGQALVLSRAPAPADFWTRFPWGKTCHFLNPLEGLLLVQGLVLFYGLLDRNHGEAVSRDP